MPPTPRQIEVLRLWVEGYELKEIALQMNISRKTVEAHKASGMERMGFSSRVDLMKHALKVGWLKSEENCHVR